MPTKKVVLFIVEGISDETSLALILSKIISNANVKFHITGGDITSNRYTTPANAKTKVNDEVKVFLDKNKFRISDIKNIVHVIDTDGTYISDDEIVEDMSVHKWVYEDDKIISNNKVETEYRNKKKSDVLNILSRTTKIRNVAYTVLYFSCNLEHVLHNTKNASKYEKSRLSDDFVDRFYKHELDFIDFIKDETFGVDGDYKETWEFIKQGCNSLNRYSNFCWYFKNN